MNQLTTVVAGVDFSACSRSALSQAARLACAHGATLHLLHVVDSLVLADFGEAIRQPSAELREEVVHDTLLALERFAGTIERPLRLEVEARVGAPAHELLARVREVSAGLLVLGAHGETDVERGVGTLATACVRSSPCETLLVQERHTGPLRTIVACVDFSPLSERVIEDALGLAALDGGRAEVVHVFYGPWHRLHYRAPTPEASPKFQQQYRNVLAARLEALAAGVARRLGQDPPECRLRESQSHGRGLVEHARERGADLLVLGTWGRTSLRHVLLGSTAERVLREATCSVLAIPPAAVAAPA